MSTNRISDLFNAIMGEASYPQQAGRIKRDEHKSMQSPMVVLEFNEDYAIEVSQIAESGQFESYYECGEKAHLVHRCNDVSCHLFHSFRFFQDALRNDQTPRVVIHDTESDIDVIVMELNDDGRETITYTSPNKRR